MVETEQSYMKEAVKLEAYNYFRTGKVGNICSYSVNDVHIFSVVKSKQVIQLTREVLSGHCTCMAGSVCISVQIINYIPNCMLV